VQICKPRSTGQAGFDIVYQEEKACRGMQDLHGWLMGLRSPESSSTQRKSSFVSCGIQKAQEKGGDQARLRPNSLSKFPCPNNSWKDLSVLLIHHVSVAFWMVAAE